MTGATVVREAGGVPAPVADGGDPFVIQKFIKSKGPHAFIVRQVKNVMHGGGMGGKKGDVWE